MAITSQECHLSLLFGVGLGTVDREYGLPWNCFEKSRRCDASPRHFPKSCLLAMDRSLARKSAIFHEVRHQALFLTMIVLTRQPLTALLSMQTSAQGNTKVSHSRPNSGKVGQLVTAIFGNHSHQEI